MNGGRPGSTMDAHRGTPIGSVPPAAQHMNKNLRNYKLLIDPFLVKGGIKLYRYDGILPNDSQYPPVQARDPRNQLARLRNRIEPLDIPVPR